ncbi:hypothetical protein BH10CYA1_BH10CYA1_48420 [soil metagenome]
MQPISITRSWKSIGLKHQAAALIALPLIAQLLFVVVMSHLLDEANAQIRQASLSREIIISCNEIMNDTYNTLQTDFFFSTIHQKHDSQLVKVYRLKQKEKFALLLNQLSEEQAPEELKQELKNCAQSITDALDSYHLAKPAEQSSLGSPDYQINFKILSSFNKLAHLLNVIAKREKAKENDQAHISEASRETIKIALYSTLALSSVLAAFISVAFHKITMRKLNILLDNTMRLASELPLNPPLRTADEFGQLDRIFHTMGETLSQAKDALEKSDLRQRLLISNMPVSIVSIDTAEKIQAVNPSSEVLFGASSDFLIGKPIESFMRLPEETLHTADFSSPITELETQGKRADGTEFIAKVTSNSYDANGERIVLLNIMDVTKEKQLEQLKLDFVAMVSHDLRTPLTSLSGFLEFLSEGQYGQLDAKGTKFLNQMQRNMDRLFTLVTNVLNIEKISSGSITVAADWVTLRDVIEAGTELVSHVASQKGVGINIQCDLSYEIYADADQITQVIMNLVSNAVKYSSPGENVEIGVLIADEEWVDIRISDRGPGVPISHQTAIFERFRQVDTRRKTEKSGSGLGLALCKGIVEQVGGSIGVSAREGGGSVFWCKLPGRCLAKPH